MRNSISRQANERQWNRTSLLCRSFLCLIGLLLCSCAHFTTNQTQKDTLDETGKVLSRQTTTTAAATTFWESKSALANFKATQTDKSQGASVGALNQESGGTNTASTVTALTELLKALK